MNRILYFIIVVAFLDTFVQLPIITPYSISLGASHLLTGAIVAVYSLTNMMGNVIGGHWIDRFGRKRMLFFGMVGVTMTLCFYPFAQTGEQLFAIRLFHGLSGGILIPAAFAYIGDLTDSKTRGRTMAFTGASIGIAAIVGPAIGGVMAARASIESVFLLIAGLFVVTTFLLLKFVEESFVSSDRTKVQMKHFIPLLKNPLLMQASLAAFALMISNGTLAFALPLKVDELGMTSQTTGLLMSVFGIVALIVFLTPLNRIYDRFLSLSLILTGITFIGLSLVLLSLLSSFGSSILSMVIYGFGFALIFPSMNQIVAEASSKLDRGKAYGIFYAFFSLGVVVGSSMSGFVSEVFGYPFLVSAAVMLTIAGIVYLISRKQAPTS